MILTGKSYYAVPYTVFNARMGSQGGASQVQPKKKKMASREHHCINPAEIDRKNCTFNTRSFMIRYCEEEVRMTNFQGGA